MRAGAGARRAVLTRIGKILVATPDDGTGLVPGTRLTKAGVGKLMVMLETRRMETDKPGTKVAQRLYTFLAEQGPEQGATVHGAKVAQLQKLQQLVQRLRRRGTRPGGPRFS